ncbi:MAG: hypothetical protein C4560_02935 [Nitrospiraceae bacterium]|nr:MAG: hypothetical protein C4560_02935 [Nitrospiraceae bacterium]
MNTENTDHRTQITDYHFLIILLCILAAFGAGMIIGGRIGERTTKQYYEEGGDDYRINNRAVHRDLGGDAAHGNIHGAERTVVR